MKTLGIVAAKKDSYRFPNKNFFSVDGKPMYKHATDILELACDNVVLATDNLNASYPNIVWRYNVKDEPIYHVVQYVYKSMKDKYDKVVVVLANSIQHTVEDIKRTISMLDDMDEVRSFDKEGIENGIIGLKSKVIYEKHEISTYLGAVITEGKEIHYEHEL